MSKLPSLQFYPGDWRKDPGVQSLSYHDRGIWFEILLLMHESEPRGMLMLNGHKMPDVALARLLGVDNQILTTTLTTLLTYGVASQCETTGALICRRMIRDEALRRVKVEAGKKGGNPALVNHVVNHVVNQNATTGVKQKPTPSYSSSVSSSDNTETQDADASNLSQVNKTTRPFHRPTPQDVAAYADEIGSAVDPHVFCDFYESNGWKVGRNAMKDWRATVRQWSARETKEQANGKQSANQAREQRNASSFEKFRALAAAASIAEGGGGPASSGAIVLSEENGGADGPSNGNMAGESERVRPQDRQ